MIDLIAGAFGAAYHLMVYYSQEFRPYMLAKSTSFFGWEYSCGIHAERKRPKKP